MSIKFKGISNTNSLNVFTWFSVDKRYNYEYEYKGVTIYTVAANTIGEAIDIILDKYGKNKWTEKTRQDFRRQDHYDAWIDHNRAKEYTKYLKARDKERKKIIGEIKEVPDTHYVGNPGVYHTEYIKFKQ